jgi:hypothetical protein
MINPHFVIEDFFPCIMPPEYSKLGVIFGGDEERTCSI